MQNEDRLRLYGYYKQATIGDRRTSNKPALLTFASVAKWEAWQSMAGLTREQAKLSYIHLVIELDKEGSVTLLDGLSKLRRR